MIWFPFITNSTFSKFPQLNYKETQKIADSLKGRLVVNMIKASAGRCDSVVSTTTADVIFRVTALTPTIDLFEGQSWEFLPSTLWSWFPSVSQGFFSVLFGLQPLQKQFVKTPI